MIISAAAPNRLRKNQRCWQISSRCSDFDDR
jgi:hypothetical protein